MVMVTDFVTIVLILRFDDPESSISVRFLSCDNDPVFKIRISLYDLEVEIESNVSYPDAITDVVNRATHAFITSLLSIKESGIELFKLIDEDADEFDD